MRRCSSCRCVALSAARTPGHFKRLGYASPGGSLPGPWLPLAVLPLPQPPAERHLPPRVRAHINRFARKVDGLRSVRINFFLSSDPIGCCDLQVGMNRIQHAASAFLSFARYSMSRLNARGRSSALMGGSRKLHGISMAQDPKRACPPDPATCRRWHPAMAPAREVATPADQLGKVDAQMPSNAFASTRSCNAGMPMRSEVRRTRQELEGRTVVYARRHDQGHRPGLRQEARRGVRRGGVRHHRAEPGAAAGNLLHWPHAGEFRPIPVRSGGKAEDLVYKGPLGRQVVGGHGTHLSLGQHRHRLDAGQRPPRRPNRYPPDGLWSAPETLLLSRSPVNGKACPATDLG
jgi:hypothetical protein